MSYTPHTWTTGETITASKMNNIEDGIQNGGGNPLIRINHNWSSASHYVSLALCEYDAGEDEYVAKMVSVPAQSYNGTLIDYSVTSYQGTDFIPSLIPVPSAGLYLILCTHLYTASNFDGNIETTPVTVAYGSTTTGYIITGNCSLTLDD